MGVVCAHPPASGKADRPRAAARSEAALCARPGGPGGGRGPSAPGGAEGGVGPPLGPRRAAGRGATPASAFTAWNCGSRGAEGAARS